MTQAVRAATSRDIIRFSKRSRPFEITGLGLEISDLLGVPVDVVPEHLVKADGLPQLVARSVPL